MPTLNSGIGNNACLRRWRLGALLVLLLITAWPALRATTVEVVDNRKIWDAGAHNAFTDLVRWHDRWWCTFREADDHVGGDGAIRVITSADGAKWESAARLTEKDVDLRDPKLTVMPDGRLMLNCGGSIYLGTKQLKGRRSRVIFSGDGRTWTVPQKILSEGDWLWRVTWRGDTAYGAAYRSGLGGSAAPGPEWELSIYRTKDGVNFERVKDMEVRGRPNETTLGFAPNGDMMALVRRETDGFMGHIGTAKPPYTMWSWQESNHRFGGQNFIRLPDGRWLVGNRDYTKIEPQKKGGATTMIAELGQDGKLTTLVNFPSGGDTSYPGLVWHDGLLWVSYYSSHEGKTSIYLAQLKVR
ncbi:MAG: hypothetical protein RL077_6219 [Verrucomicrobiota bacterium]|jgi:hypothetical protein